MTKFAALPHLGHPRLAHDSAERYLKQLRKSQADARITLTARTHRALDFLITSIEAGLNAGAGLAVASAPFSWRVMAEVPRKEAPIFISQSQLGWGSDLARLIAVGSEQNFDLSDAPGLGAITLDCASQIVWLSNSNPKVMAELGEGQAWQSKFTAEAQAALGPYHVYTARYHKSSPRGTWQHLGRQILGGGPDWQQAPGDGCYQLELKGDPARRADQGRAVDDRRIAFMVHSFELLRTTAVVLLFHGKRTHAAARQLASSFLGTNALPPPTCHEVPGKSGRIRSCVQYDANGRRVLLTWAMNAGAVNWDPDYLRLVRELVHERLVAAQRGEVPDLDAAFVTREIAGSSRELQS